MYDNEEKQRECLVVRNGWTPDVAERRLAARRAELRRLADSLEGALAIARQG
ncbi:MAG: hypothetical protein ABI662_12475 [Dermatophilaceae bacterium]